MKKAIFISLFLILSISCFSQWNNTGNNSTTGNLSVKGNIIFNGEKLLTAVYGDNFKYNNQYMGHYAIKWGVDSIIGGPPYTMWLSSYNGFRFFTAGKARLVISRIGNVGIDVTSPTHKFEVNGTIRSKEVKIEATNWADFVFDKDYKLPSLAEVETHIKEYKHLPDIPSKKEVMENGITVGEMQAKLLQKIEELTLYVIELKKENESIKKELKEIKKE